MSAEKFCIQWNKFEKDLSSAFRSIREDKDFFDITIVCEDEQIEAHKVILSACRTRLIQIIKKVQICSIYTDNRKSTDTFFISPIRTKGAVATNAALLVTSACLSMFATATISLKK